VSTYSGHSYCRQYFVEALHRISGDKFIVWNGDNLWGFDDFETKVYTPKKGQTPVEVMRDKQNIIRRKFLEGGYTHLLMLESDNIPPDDVVERLLAHDRDVVTGTYFIKTVNDVVFHANEAVKNKCVAEGMEEPDAVFVIKQSVIPSFWGIFESSLFSGRAGRLWTMDDYLSFKRRGVGLIPILGAGVGCVLISRNVMKKIKFRLDEENFGKQFTDFIFYIDARRHKFETFADLDCFVEHIHIDFRDELNTTKWFDPESMTRIKTGYVET